jgi:hypothetical protein
MLSGHAAFHGQSGDDGAAVMARIKGEEFSFNTNALNHISSEAKYVTKGKNSGKYVKIESRQNNSIFFNSKVLVFDNKFIYFYLQVQLRYN